MNPYYEDERVVLHRGDALAVLASLPDACVDGIIADPPYSSGGQFRGDRIQATSVKYRDSDALQEIPDFSGDTRDSRAYGYWSALWLGEALRVIGVELHEHFATVAERRIREAQGQAVPRGAQGALNLGGVA